MEVLLQCLRCGHKYGTNITNSWLGAVGGGNSKIVYVMREALSHMAYVSSMVDHKYSTICGIPYMVNSLYMVSRKWMSICSTIPYGESLCMNK